MTKVINLLAGPSAGKSTNAYLLTGLMKEKRMNVEFAGEFAKDEVWRHPGFAHIPLNNQIAIFAEQNTRIYSLIDQVDYVVTDGSLLQGLVYIHNSHSKFKTNRIGWENLFENFIITTYFQYNNINFFIDRGERAFVPDGRIHSLQESVKKDEETLEMLKKVGVKYEVVSSVKEILEHLKI